MNTNGRTLLAVALMLLLLPLGAVHAQGKSENDRFVLFPGNYVEGRWCLNGAVTIIQPEFETNFLNMGKVELEQKTVSTNCAVKTMFGSKDLLKIHSSGADLGLTITDKNSAMKHRDLPLKADTAEEPPRFWMHEGDDFTFFVMLAEALDSDEKLVKYYRIEVFANDEDKDCLDERPDHPGALVRISDATSCPTLSKTELDTLQTGVGGGGEGR